MPTLRTFHCPKILHRPAMVAKVEERGSGVAVFDLAAPGPGFHGAGAAAEEELAILGVDDCDVGEHAVVAFHEEGGFFGWGWEVREVEGKGTGFERWWHIDYR
jgi:hypothetical protein